LSTNRKNYHLRIAAKQLTICIYEYRFLRIFPNMEYLLRYNILKVVHVAASSYESSSVAFIFLTHILSGSIFNEYKKIQTSTEGLGVPWFLFQGAADQLSRVRKIKNVYTVSRADLLAMDYPNLNPEIVPGSVLFPLLRFYNHHPEYRYYWLIEYDVRFSGNWRVLFSDFSGFEADFIAAHVRNYSEEPDWERWNISHPTQSIPLEDRLRCFHPVLRISNLALNFISSVYRQEWRGHSEVLLPTLLQQNGFSIQDFGGNGSFVPPGMKNKYYTDALPNRKGFLDTGSMRYRPSYARPGLERNKLYHPIKPRATRWKMQIRSFLTLLFGKQRAGKIVSILKSLSEKAHSSEDHS